MLRMFTVWFILCCFSIGCATNGALRAFSKINNEPIKEVKSFEILKDGSYKICVIGKLRNNEFGDYQILITQEQTKNTGFRCRNDKRFRYGEKYFCEEYTIPIINAKDEEVHWQCQTVDKSSDAKYSLAIAGENSRILIVRDANNQDVAEIHIDEIWEATNPIVYLFMPFTVAFDVLTFPIQFASANR